MKTIWGVPWAIPGAAAALLLTLLAAEWLPGSGKAIALPPPSLHPRGAAAETDSVAKDTDAWADTIIARPLFAMNRRPPKLAGGRSTVAATGVPRLSGIIIDGVSRRAIFAPEGGKARTLAEGAMLDDYKVLRIATDRVTLSGIKGEMVLRPTYDGSRAGTPGEMGQAGMAQAGMAQPGFQPPVFNPGFRPGFQPQPPPQPQPAGEPDDDNDDATPAQPAAPQPFPGFRGPFIPRRNNE